MDKRRLSLPGQRNYEYALTSAYELACEQLVKIKDIEQQCRNCGAEYLEINSRKVITLSFLNQRYQITLPAIEVTPLDSQEEVPLKTRVLLLHYFIRAQGTPLSGRMISFKELPEGAIYFPTFAKRTINPLLKHFTKDAHRLIEAALKIGGRKVDYGDVAVTIDAFRYTPITLVLWQGDEEFGPQASILFDSVINSYLSTEDIIVVCEVVVWTLIRSLKPARVSQP